MPRRITFLSAHCWQSARRAGFHALAQAFADGGWTVRFVATGFSRLSFLKSNSRVDQIRGLPRNQWVIDEAGVESFLYCPPVHPIARTGVSFITDTVFTRLYRSGLNDAFWEKAAATDVFVFESNASLLLAEDIARKVPRAALVYRVSDDVRMLDMAQSIRNAEDRMIDQFSVVSVPSRHLLDRRFAALNNTRFQPHGIDIPRLEAAKSAPKLDLEHPSCVLLGSTLFNREMLRLCAEARPDVTFHVVGAVEPAELSDLANIRWWGERPFDDALQIAASCNFAAAFYIYRQGGEYLAETSNKIAQYQFLNLPMIGPDWLSGSLQDPSYHGITEDSPHPASVAISRALEQVGRAPRTRLFQSWDQVREDLVSSLG